MLKICSWWANGDMTGSLAGGIKWKPLSPWEYLKDLSHPLSSCLVMSSLTHPCALTMSAWLKKRPAVNGGWINQSTYLKCLYPDPTHLRTSPAIPNSIPIKAGTFSLPRPDTHDLHWDSIPCPCMHERGPNYSFYWAPFCCPADPFNLGGTIRNSKIEDALKAIVLDKIFLE